jgi:hypothetical protein
MVWMRPEMWVSLLSYDEESATLMVKSIMKKRRLARLCRADDTDSTERILFFFKHLQSATVVSGRSSGDVCTHSL